MSDDLIQFRHMTAEDIPTGLELCRASRWNQLSRDWDIFLKLSPADCRVAVKNNQVVGTVTTVSYQDRFSWIGMVLVDPAERRQGIGMRLLQEAIDLLKRQKLIGLDATPAGREVYLKLGFTDQSRLRRMETLVSTGFARIESGSARPMTEDDLPEVFKLDREIFGADRSLILQWLFDGAPEYARVLPGEEAVRAFMFGRHGFSFEHIGPVIADDVESARQLVAACLAEQAGKKFILDATCHDTEWMRWLESIGFQEQRSFIRMYRGEGEVPGLPEKQFAILGPEFG